MKERIDNFIKVARESGKPKNWQKLYETLTKTIPNTNEHLPYLHEQWNNWITEIEIAKWDADFTEQIINGGVSPKKEPNPTAPTSQGQLNGFQNNQLNGLANAGMVGNDAYDAYGYHPIGHAQMMQAQNMQAQYESEKEKAEYYNSLHRGIGVAQNTVQKNIIQRWLGQE